MHDEGGYRTFPYAVSRYDQAPREVYGRGPAQMVLPALKTLNAQKATSSRPGHRAVDPVLLTADDGVVGLAQIGPARRTRRRQRRGQGTSQGVAERPGADRQGNDGRGTRH